MTYVVRDDIIQHNMDILNENRAEFQRRFDIPLTRFMHPILGFDVVSFDKWLCTPDGVSTHDYLIEKYDSSAPIFIRTLF